MAKVEVTPQSLIPLRPILIVGVNVGGKTDFVTIGAGGMLSYVPPTVAIPFQHQRYSLKGVLENRTFSVNIPSVDQVVESDYCGIVSGKDRDKAKDCKFNIFYGKLGTAPMIDQFGINLECSLLHVMGTKSHFIVIGEVVATFISSEYVKDGKLDAAIFNPLLWYPDKREYVAVSKSLGRPHSAGNELKIEG